MMGEMMALIDEQKKSIIENNELIIELLKNRK